MNTPTVPSKEATQYNVPMLQEPIPETSTQELIKLIGLGLAITVGQFAVLIFLLGLAVHR
jgi:hypothetical protein